MHGANSRECCCCCCPLLLLLLPPCSIDNRAVLELPGSLFGSDANSAIITTATDPTALKLRYQHGTLMAVNFVLVFPLGALIARQLRARWLSSLAVKAVLFYLHITVQVWLPGTTFLNISKSQSNQQRSGMHRRVRGLR